MFYLFILQHSRGGGGNPSHDIQLLVQRSQVGSIIGRAGYKIKEIREVSSPLALTSL